MLSTVDCYAIARESNVVRVDFSRDPDPPAPCLPGANGLRLSDIARDDADAPTAIAIGTAGHDGDRAFRGTTSACRSAWAAKSENLARHLELRAQLPNSVRD
jgi:hypothetical protein